MFLSFSVTLKYNKCMFGHQGTGAGVMVTFRHYHIALCVDLGPYLCFAQMHEENTQESKDFLLKVEKLQSLLLQKQHFSPGSAKSQHLKCYYIPWGSEVWGGRSTGKGNDSLEQFNWESFNKYQSAHRGLIWMLMSELQAQNQSVSCFQHRMSLLIKFFQ